MKAVLMCLCVATMAACGTTTASTRPAPGPVVAPVPPRPPQPPNPHADEVDGLILRLFNEDDQVRIDGARRLGALGAYARPALAYLRDCARQDDGDSAGECAAAARLVEDAAQEQLRVARGTTP